MRWIGWVGFGLGKPRAASCSIAVAVDSINQRKEEEKDTPASHPCFVWFVFILFHFISKNSNKPNESSGPAKRVDLN